ncbi:SDR family oxidoreductase [Aestuariivirga sp.]|uniref:SDR family oxidoreductase n=1 Tax=Aestuariivirga sp. TaxID=2650926 RepID=UPI00391C577A
MRVLLIGATGLIGSAVAARLPGEGHEVVPVSRRPMDRPGAIILDMARATAPEVWLPHLRGIDAVVNCAGVLQDGPRENTRAVHAAGAAALFEACERAGVRRVIHFSAIGVDRAQPSAFSASKLAGDEALMARDLDWVILRPSVVLGRSVFGASALMRGLAALPVLPSMPETEKLQVVRLEDVVETVLFFLDPRAPSRLSLELAGPQALGMDEIVGQYRRWLGWKPARRYQLPPWLARLLYKAGDIAAALGWRPPVRTNAAREMTRGAMGDPAPWSEITGITPRPLAAALAAEPAGVQEKWFAGLYVLKPVIFVVLAAFWLATAIISVTIGYELGVELMVVAGAGALAGPAVIAGALADLVIGLLIAWRRTTRLGLWGALALSGFYIVAGSILRPDLWAEPLGPFLKIFPIVVLHLVALAVLEER